MRVELELEHRYQDKFLGRHRLSQQGGLTVIGSAINADIRLFGDDVSAIHAYIENDGDQWRLIDAGSEKGTWISKKAITSQELKETEIVARIGAHELRLRPRALDFELFSQDHSDLESTTGTNLYHQVILRKRGQVLRTLLLPETEVYSLTLNGKNRSFPPPNKGEFLTTEMEGFTVQQRMVLSGPVVDTSDKVWDGIWGSQLKMAFMGLVALLFLGGFLSLFLFSDQEAELLPPEVQQNRFTKMIYDADTIKKKRAEARKKQQVFASQPKASSAKVAPARSSSTARPKVVSQLKMQGLQSLLGKIAKRANSTGPKIVTAGRSPSANTGPASATPVSASLQSVKTEAGSGGPKFKVAAVGTVGKGGGGSTNGLGGLALGGAGSASVGIVDEETEIEGGLDKDVIAQVIRSQLGEIRYCYERQLAANPDMYGKVVIGFSISSSGGVSTQRVKRSTINSAMVEGCILRRVAGWRFPKPKGGTTVVVTYPFLFKSTN